MEGSRHQVQTVVDRKRCKRKHEQCLTAPSRMVCNLLVVSQEAGASVSIYAQKMPIALCTPVVGEVQVEARAECHRPA